MSPKAKADFQQRIWDFYHDHGRDLPWRREPTPYQVVISEVMLQQTQVSRVRDYYAHWLEGWPNFAALAAASRAEVLEAWQGLGYNRRALWLHKLAQSVVNDHHGELPSDPAELVKLPGIGPNTAGSIAAFAFNLPIVFIETNLRRVFIHEFFGDEEEISDKQLLPLIEATLDRAEPRQWYYALMDYGAHLAKTVPNPNRRSKHYMVQSRFEGSRRQLRGEVLRRLLQGSKTVDELALDDERLPEVLASLTSEGFVRRRGEHYEVVG